MIENSVAQPSLLALFMVLIAALEWWRSYADMKPSPLIFSIAAVATLAYASIRIWRAIPKIRNLRLALEGERAVGQFLERLRGDGYQVFHDVVGMGFNIDHVLVGPAGVFCVETKTWSKPVQGSARIVFDGSALTVGGLTPERDPIIQSAAQASWLRALLKESTGKPFMVRPIILFPGWYIDNIHQSFDQVWVLEPKALPTFLCNARRELREDDIKLASYHLSRQIRVSQKQTPEIR